MGRIKTLVVASDADLSRDLSFLLNQAPDLDVLDETLDASAAVERVHYLEPEVVIVGLSSLQAESLALVDAIRRARSSVKVLALSQTDDRRFIAALQAAGAAVHIQTAALEGVLDAVRTIMRKDLTISNAAVPKGEVSQTRAQDTVESSRRRARMPLLPILTTKLYPPPVTPDLERREQLLDLMKRNRYRPLTLISAPAGYGKSVLASMWLQNCGCPGAWISLDADDSNLVTFASYMLAAIESIFPDLELSARALLDRSDAAPPREFARYLLNDLERAESAFVLVLDDLQRIQSQPVFDLLSELLHHPSQKMHVVLISRHDPPLPVPTLRARRQVTEIRARDLRFGVSETRRLLERMLSRPVEEQLAAQWTERTEGWVTAIRLGALSLRHSSRVTSLAMDVVGDNHYLQEYLLAEVLAQQTPVIQAWLLKTAVLDRFCASLCESVCRSGENDLTGKAFVTWAQDSNLLVIPLDNRGRWFRYHHLFQQQLCNMLQAYLQPDEIASLHSRASKWFEEQDLLDEAIRHALAANDRETAVRVISQHRHALMAAGQWHRLEQWIAWMPDEFVREEPVLLGTVGLIAIHRGRDKEWEWVGRQLQQILPTMAPDIPERTHVEGELRLFQAATTLLPGETARGLSLARESLRLLPKDAAYARMAALLGVLMGLQAEGQYAQCILLLDEALNESAWSGYLQAQLRVTSGLVAAMEGDLVGLISMVSEALRIGTELGRADAVSLARYLLGAAHYCRNELKEAETYLSALMEERDSGAPSYVGQGTCILALIYAARGEETKAEDTVDLLYYYMQERKFPFARKSIAAFRVELALRLGKLDTALSRDAGVDYDPRPPNWFLYLPQLTPVKLLLARGGRENLTKARAMLETQATWTRSTRRHFAGIQVLGLLGLVCDAQGDTAGAYAAIREALMLARPGGIVRSFLDLGPPMAELLTRYVNHQATQRAATEQERDIAGFVEHIQAGFAPPEHSHVPSDPLVQLPNSSLTQREQETIELLATEMSPLEIAAEMSVSLATVRSHTKNIYSKLEVHGRYEAVQRARALGLL